MLASGVLDRRIEDEDDPVRARRVPSPQLVGTAERASLDLGVLRKRGVEIVGRLAAVRGDKALLSGSLRNVCALADLKMNRLLDELDAWAIDTGLTRDVDPVERFAPTDVGPSPRLSLCLGDDIRTVLWCTGFRPDYTWLDVPVLDAKGRLKHDRGVVEAPGLYALGLPYMRRRKSSFIHGAEDDVRELCAHLVGYLEGSRTVDRVTEAAPDSGPASGQARPRR
jgi:putative flavoprotein involved in K+ transport